MKHQGSQEQQALFQWATYNTKLYPELELLYHCPNGGRRDIMEAARLKAEGVRAGVPDIHLPAPRGMHHGLYIEMKAAKGKISENQKWWIERLSKQGYRVVVCYSWVEAKEEIEKYLTIR